MLKVTGHRASARLLALRCLLRFHARVLLWWNLFSGFLCGAASNIVLAPKGLGSLEILGLGILGSQGTGGVVFLLP